MVHVVRVGVPIVPVATAQVATVATAQVATVATATVPGAMVRLTAAQAMLGGAGGGGGGTPH
eukprot:scaffold21430_cov45-Isochrysis_galbana.AAC.1